MGRGPFSGTQRITTALPLSGLADLAIHCWAYQLGSQAANNRIFQMGDGSHGVGIGYQLTGRTMQVVDEVVAWRGSGAVIPDGVWTSLGLARGGGGSWQVFVNGVNIENPGAAPNALAGQLTLGNDISATHSFNGFLGPFSVWSTALTAAEFVRLTAGISPMSIRFASLQLHIPMFGIGGISAGEGDYSPFQRSGTQTGNPGLFNSPTTAPPISV